MKQINDSHASTHAQTRTQDEQREIPDVVSWRVVDAWKAIPPCSYTTNPYCHVQCPYFDECNNDYGYYEDEYPDDFQ